MEELSLVQMLVSMVTFCSIVAYDRCLQVEIIIVMRYSNYWGSERYDDTKARGKVNTKWKPSYKW